MASARTGNMDHARTNESDHKNLLQETNWKRLLTESHLYTYSSKRCLIPDFAILDISLIRLLSNFLPKAQQKLKKLWKLIWVFFFVLPLILQQSLSMRIIWTRPICSLLKIFWIDAHLELNLVSICGNLR